MKTFTLERAVTVVAAAALLIVFGLVVLPAWKVAGLWATLAALGGLSAVGMIIDDRGEFADATALSTAGTGLALVGDVVNLSVAKGVGANIDKPLYLVISVDTAVTSAGAATVAFVLASDAQAAIATDGSATEHFRTRAIPKATLVAGYQLVFAVPPPPPDYEQYLGILQDVGTAALTAGKINAYLTASPSVWSARADAI
jgi:hypothetical protein